MAQQRTQACQCLQTYGPRPKGLDLRAKGRQDRQTRSRDTRRAPSNGSAKNPGMPVPALRGRDGVRRLLGEDS